MIPDASEATVFLVSFSQAHLLDDHAESLMRLAPLIERLAGEVGLGMTGCLKLSQNKPPREMVI